MKCIRILIVLMAIIFGQGIMFAQEGEQTTQTHAEATSQKWHGIDVSTVINNNAYPDNNSLTSGYPFLLFNVGTGRFIVQGGDWAMEGRLFYSDFGRTMYLYKNGRINSGLTEAGVSATKNSFCCRPPVPFSKSWDNYNTVNLTTLLDGSKQSKFNLQWKFERVEDSSNTDTYTYYMHLEHTVSPQVNYYLGAAWGEWHVQNGKGDGFFIYLDDDRSCWTTVNVTDENAIKAVPLWDTTTENGVYLKQEDGKAMLESGDEVEIQKLYQWRLISLEEFIEVLNDDGMGLNPSISSLISDRDFTRNSDDFYAGFSAYDHWIVSPLSGYPYAEGTQRYTYTSADYMKGSTKDNNNQWYNNQRSIDGRVVEEAWDSPVQLKVVFDRKINSATNNDGNTIRDSQQDAMKNAKFGFLPFEGVGTISTNFLAPKPGWYQIECVGFSMSEHDHDAYLFARVIPNSRADDLENTFEVPSTEQPHYGKVTLQKLPFGTYSKNTYPACLEVGRELLYNADAHKQKVWVLISQEDWDNKNRTIRVGIGKDLATQSQEMKTNAFYDTDWVCVDDIRASYMGLSPVFFYEDQEDLRYLSHDPADNDRFSPNEYTPAVKNGRYAGAACLQRKFTKNEWNTFSFPLPLTGEQVRNAFGDKSKLLVLNSIGNLSHNDCIIDFKTVPLLTVENVVTAGNLYMLKPSKDPAYGENPRGEMDHYYDLGKMFFSTNADDKNNPEYKNPVIDLSVQNVWSGHQDVDSYKNKNNGVGHVTYIQTPYFDDFRVDRVGVKLSAVPSPEGSYAPKGSYAMSGGKMYELSRDTRIKGFRGWITLTHSIFPDSESAAAGAKIAINGVIESDVPTAIDRDAVVPVNPKSINAVYDLSGRKVGTSVEGLPKGLYIVGGKKLLVK